MRSKLNCKVTIHRNENGSLYFSRNRSTSDNAGAANFRRACQNLGINTTLNGSQQYREQRSDDIDYDKSISLLKELKFLGIEDFNGIEYLGNLT